jgi:hypothetical protein
MRGVFKVMSAAAVVLVVAGLLVTATSKLRDAERRTRCHNTLMHLGLAAQNYHSTLNRFPAGTVRNAELPPDKRLSWLAELVPFTEASLDDYLIEKKEAWDAADNCPLRCRRYAGKTSSEYREFRNAGPPYFLCPAGPPRSAPDFPYPTSFVGIAGLGESAAELPLSDPRAGFFGYDRTARSGDIKDGLANTLMTAEVLDGGPWSAGGRATVRGLSADRPYLGGKGQFASLHGGGILRTGPAVTNAVFADGSVRPLADSVSREVFEALATIAGGEEVGPW